MKKRGFTLIELLIVIAIIAILAAIVFVALDPLKRFRDARDSRRFADIAAILSAIRVNQVDNGGNYITAIGGLTAATNYMIGTNTGGTCITNTPCAVTVTNGNCVDLTELKDDGYLGTVPESPAESGTWGPGKTGYYLVKNANNSITVGACEAGTGAITLTR